MHPVYPNIPEAIQPLPSPSKMAMTAALMMLAFFDWDENELVVNIEASENSVSTSYAHMKTGREIRIPWAISDLQLLW